MRQSVVSCRFRRSVWFGDRDLWRWDGTEAKQIAAHVGPQVWVGRNRIIWTSRSDRGRELWSAPLEGGSPRLERAQGALVVWEKDDVVLWGGPDIGLGTDDLLWHQGERPVLRSRGLAPFVGMMRSFELHPVGDQLLVRLFDTWWWIPTEPVP